ncbi:MAG: DUF1153 domain-containing protein [Proteobacteria bacterium]|nr:DUF1153 domain-containing protein [Pseudomonadota bacterium]
MAIQKSSAQLYELKQPARSADLPPAGVTRWVPSRKAQVVSAVHNGILSLDEACGRYALTVEEFLSWQRAIERFGLSGLRATRAQLYRQTRH